MDTEVDGVARFAEQGLSIGPLRAMEHLDTVVDGRIQSLAVGSLWHEPVGRQRRLSGGY